MTVAPLAPRIESLARPFLLSLPAEHRRIQVQREPGYRTPDQPQQPPPERTPERLDVRLPKPEEEVTDRVIAGKAGQAQHRVEDAVGAQPFTMGEPPSPHHDGHQERRQRMRQRNGVVGGRFGERQMLLNFAGEAGLAREGDEAGQTAEGRNRLGRFVQNQLGFPKERRNFGAGRFVQGRRGLFKHQSLCHQPFPHCDPFPTSEFGFRRPRVMAERAITSATEQ